MWRSKLAEALATPLDGLMLEPGHAASRKYLWLGPGEAELNRALGEPFVLGQLIGEGDEARVYELVNLKTGSWHNVVKICKFPPDSPRYKTWLTTVRDEINPHSHLPNIEQMEAQLVSVPGGAVKLQPYVSPNPEEDWNSVLPIKDVLLAFQRGELEQASTLIDALISKYGPKAMLLEQQAIVLRANGKLEEARDVLMRAVEGYRDVGSTNILAAYANLANILMVLYEASQDDLPGMMKLTLNDGTVLRQQIGGPLSPDMSEEDWERQLEMDRDYTDQALEVYLEALSVEPYFLPALEGVYRLVGDVSEMGLEILNAICRVFPQAKPLFAEEIELRQKGIQAMEDAQLSAADVNVPSDIQTLLREHSKRYKPPVPDGADQAISQALSARQYAAEGFLEKAMDAARMAVELDPECPRYLALVCDIHCLMDDWNQAYHVAKDGVEAFTDSFELYEVLGRICDQLGEYRESCIAFHKAVSCDLEGNPVLKARLGNAYRRLKKFEKSIELLVQAGATANDHDLVAYFYLLALRDHALADESVFRKRTIDAFSEIDRLRKIGTITANHLMVGAQMSVASRNFEAAKSYLEEAQQMDSNHAPSREFLKAIRDEYPD
jgi:tetratricopeptide (TPR) repeat protein